MTDFLEAIAVMESKDASVQTLFGGEGVGVRHSGLKNKQEYRSRLLETARFLEQIVKGQRPVYHLQEAMTTSDFPYLFGDVLDRVMLGSYNEFPSTIEAIFRMRRVRDFRTVSRFTVDGLEGQLESVPEQAPYPEAALSEGRYQYSVAKYGRRFPISWETRINDDLDALNEIPARFGRAARRTRQKFMTGLYVDASGPHASFFTSGNSNILAANTVLGTPINAPLSALALQAAMAQKMRMLDADSEPIAETVFHLVVGPGLSIVARNILNALTIELNLAGGTLTGLSNSSGLESRLITTNWVKENIVLHVDPYIPIVASSANGATSWFLFSSPGVGRPAMEFATLIGHEVPEIFIKEPNARRVGGDGINPMDGDFDTDSIQYKVRDVFGGGRMDPKLAIASNGSGS